MRVIISIGWVGPVRKMLNMPHFFVLNRVKCRSTPTVTVVSAAPVMWFLLTLLKTLFFQTLQKPNFHTSLTELENLSFQYRCPREYALLEKLLREEFESERTHIEAFTSKIETLLAKGGIKARTEVRYRKPYSIWMKMHSKGCDFAHVNTKYYVRVVYQNQEPWSEKDTSLRIYSILTDVFKERPGSVSNYIDAPKENGYQSFQVKLLNEKGRWEELHISSERMVRNGRLGCAAERTDENIQSWLNKFNELLKEVADQEAGMDFMDGVTSSFYYDDIMVFTPKGKCVILPKGATALDFAFEIHSRIGEHAHYARINGKLSSVKTVLKRGDCVEIGTSDSVEPDPSWLDHVSTYKARKSINSHLSRMTGSHYVRCPHCHPLPGDEVIGFKKNDGSIEVHKRNCQTAIRLASQHGDSIVAVNFEEESRCLYPAHVKMSQQGGGGGDEVVFVHVGAAQLPYCQHDQQRAGEHRRPQSHRQGVAGDQKALSIHGGGIQLSVQIQHQHGQKKNNGRKPCDLLVLLHKHTPFSGAIPSILFCNVLYQSVRPISTPLGKNSL